MAAKMPSPLRRARHLLDLTLDQVAEKVGTTNSQVSLWENGHVAPSPGHREAYANVLGLSLAELAAACWELQQARHRDATPAAGVPVLPDSESAP